MQIEHAEANPSLGTLLKLAAALGVTLTELVSAQPHVRPVGVVPERDAMTLWSTSAGSSARLLVSSGPLELWSWTLAPGDRRTSDPHRPGSLELLSVATGKVTLEVGDDRAEVPAGDGAWVDVTFGTPTPTRRRPPRPSHSSCSSPHDTDWRACMVEEPAPGLIRIPLLEGFVAAYLVADEGELTLVDTGPPGSLAAIEDARPRRAWTSGG